MGGWSSFDEAYSRVRRRQKRAREGVGPSRARRAVRYGSETVVASPVAEILKVPDAVEAAYAYGELQPAGGGGTFAMNGPAVWPWVLVATTVRSVRAVGSTPMWAA